MTETNNTLHNSFKKLTNRTEEQKLAFARFHASGFPHRKLEAFKYTGLQAQNYANFEHSPLSIKNTTPAKPSNVFSTVDCIHLNLINGVLISVHTNEKGLSIANKKTSNLNASIKTIPLQSTAAWNSLNDLNQAFSSDGFYIHVDQNTKINKPIVIHHHVNEEINVQAIHNRNHVQLCSGSQATIIEIFDSSSESNHYFQNQVLTVHCEKNAHVKIIRIQNDATQSIHQSCVDISQDQDSQSEFFSFSFGSEHFRLDISTQLNGNHAYSKLNGLYVSQSKQNHDHFTNIYHGQPHTQSEELFKGILSDTAHASFTGKIRVEKAAQKIESTQMNRNLMLSQHAQVNSAPQLEIFADDVKCTHGSTIGELNSEELFYLRSRGFSELEAKKALIHAYAKEVIDQTKLQFLEPLLEKLLLEKLKINNPG